ncbi:MAG TPA: alkaline phosphatase, partial [Paenibacillus sp.]|nr:alkaline phosphatase [Paenibacillus sp.]
MQAWITDFMEQFGYFGIFLMLAFENIFPPIPSEVILPFGGFMTTTTNLTIPGVIIAATLGSLLGAVILYYIGRLLDVNRLEKIVERWGGLLRISKKDIHKADAWFDKYGYWTVLFCRMVPLVRSLISIPAGMSGMKFGVF